MLSRFHSGVYFVFPKKRELATLLKTQSCNPLDPYLRQNDNLDSV